MVRMSVPRWSRWVAKECRKVCALMVFVSPARRTATLIEFVQDTHGDGESLVCLGLLHQSQHRMEGIKQHALTSSGDVAEQATFDRVALRAIRRGMRHADRYGKVVDHALAVLLEQMLVTTVTASAIAQEQDR